MGHDALSGYQTGYQLILVPPLVKCQTLYLAPSFLTQTQPRKGAFSPFYRLGH